MKLDWKPVSDTLEHFAAQGEEKRHYTIDRNSMGYWTVAKYNDGVYKRQEVRISFAGAKARAQIWENHDAR